MTTSRNGAGIEARLARLEDERAISETLYRYSRSLDHNTVDEFVDCFTKDGMFRRALPPTPIQGREGLARYIKDRMAQTGIVSRHCVVEPIITMGDGEARVQSYIVVVAAQGQGQPFLQAFGQYRDHMVKGQDGKWRFKERIVQIEGRAGD